MLGLKGSRYAPEQYGRRNNLKITRIPNDVSDENLEEKKFNFVVSFRLTHFSPVSHFYTPLKRQKSKG